MLPKHIEEQEKAAEELHAKIYGNPGQKQDEPKPAAPQPAAAAPAPAGAPSGAPVPAPSQPNDGSGEPKPAEPPVKALKAPDDKVDDPVYWKHRAELIAGKYEAEVPRYAQENRQLKTELEKLRAQQPAAAAEPSASPASAAPAEPSIPQDLIEKYGEDFIADIRRVIPATAAPAPSATPADLVARVERTEKTLEEQRFDTFKTRLAEKSPDWEKLNTDPNFLTWLAGIDELSGRPRQDLLDEAVGRRDYDRTARFFNTFANQGQSWEGLNPQTGAPFVPPPLAESLAPRASKAGDAPPAKKLWTSTEISQFYDDVRRGRVQEADAARIEADIFAAQREGRIR